jgi:hypothetical protein
MAARYAELFFGSWSEADAVANAEEAAWCPEPDAARIRFPAAHRSSRSRRSCRAAIEEAPGRELAVLIMSIASPKNGLCSVLQRKSESGSLFCRALGVVVGGGDRIERYAGREPPLALEAFFSGRARGGGVLQSRFGNLINHFTVDAEGDWHPESDTLSLVETYRFDDGRSDRLEWRIIALGRGRYRGSEPRVEGEATGEQAGNAFHWRYTRRVPSPKGEQRLHFDDWFWLTGNDLLISRADVKRFGVTIATMSVFYQRTGGGGPQAA